MRFHLVGLPHTQSTAEYSNCAFNSLLRGFARMMTDRGHEVIVYSGEDNDAACTEHVTCISKEQQKRILNVAGPDDILKPPLDTELYLENNPIWAVWNSLVMEELKSRLQPHDFVCIIGGGTLFEPLITYANSRECIAVEYAIGYAGVSQRTFHAFGSSNWRHTVYGLGRMGNPVDQGWRMAFYDRVIPHYFDPNDFEYRDDKGDYLLYLGKIKEDKGVNIAARASEAAGRKLIVAGQGPTPVEYGEVLNRRIGPDERRELLAGAAGVFVPSLYVEPFGMVAVEALLSGTPIITTPWGGLEEINEPGVGFQCHTLRDFADAAAAVGDLTPRRCFTAGLKYAYATVSPQYERWFRDLEGLWNTEGWGAL